MKVSGVKTLFYTIDYDAVFKALFHTDIVTTTRKEAEVAVKREFF